MRAAVSPSAPASTSCTSSPSRSTASAGSRSTAASTAAFSSGVRWRKISSMTATGMPARCSSRNGPPASTALSCAVSPTGTSLPTPSVSATRISACMSTVPTIDASSSTSTVPA